MMTREQARAIVGAYTMHPDEQAVYEALWATVEACGDEEVNLYRPLLNFFTDCMCAVQCEMAPGDAGAIGTATGKLVATLESLLIAKYIVADFFRDAVEDGT